MLTALSAPSTRHFDGWKQRRECSPATNKTSRVQQALLRGGRHHDGPDRCSPAYCLKKKKGVQECRFGYPKPLQPVTTIDMEGSTPTLLTQRNDCLLNSYNPVQLHRVTKQGPQLYCQVCCQVGASIQRLEGSVQQCLEDTEE